MSLKWVKAEKDRLLGEDLLAKGYSVKDFKESKASRHIA